MAKTRALLTETEREQIAGEHGDERRYQATSRVRRRVTEELTTDVAVLIDHHPDLLAELRGVVCGERAETADAETQLKRLSTDLGEPITIGDTVYEDGDAHPLDAPETPEHAVERGPDPDAGERPESVAGVDVDALDLPGGGEDLRRRQNAVRAVLDHLREHGEARTADLKELAWEVDEGTYDDPRSLWKNCILSGALSPLDVVASSGPSGKWRWVGSGGE